MCLPITFLKTIVGISCLVCMALGVIAIICGATLGKDEIFVDAVEKSRQIFMGVTIAFGVTLIILAIVGIIGTYKKSSLCLTIYNIGVFVLFLIFLVVGIACLVVFKKYSSDDIQNTNFCKDQDWLQTLDNYAVQANDLLCSANCPCSASVNSTWIPADRRAYVVADGQSSVVKVQDCQYYNNSAANEVSVMKYLEEHYSCAGICTTSDFYTFSDLNRGKPSDECSQKLMDTLLTYAKQIGAVTLTIAGILLLIMVLSCCLCCHPQKKELDQAELQGKE